MNNIKYFTIHFCTYYLLRRHSSKHFQGIYVLSVDPEKETWGPNLVLQASEIPPQNTLLVKQTEKLVCCCGGESFRENLPDQPIERSWVLRKNTFEYFGAWFGDFHGKQPVGRSPHQRQPQGREGCIFWAWSIILGEVPLVTLLVRSKKCSFAKLEFCSGGN